MSLLTSLYAYYKLDGNSTDSVGSFNGTDTGTLNYSTSNGKIDQGIQVTSASTANIEIGTSADFTFIQNTGEFTISLWWREISYTTNSGVIANTGTSSDKGFFLFKSGQNLRFVAVRGDGIAGSLINSTYTNFFTDNNWHHVVVTGSKANNRVRFYKDGVLFTPTSGTTVGTLSSGNSTRATKMGYVLSLGVACNSAIDEVGFWSRELDGTEVSILYNGGSGLTYPFISDTGNFFNLF